MNWKLKIYVVVCCCIKFTAPWNGQELMAAYSFILFNDRCEMVPRCSCHWSLPVPAATTAAQISRSVSANPWPPNPCLGCWFRLQWALKNGLQFCLRNKRLKSFENSNWSCQDALSHFCENWDVALTLEPLCTSVHQALEGAIGMWFWFSHPFKCMQGW